VGNFFFYLCEKLTVKLNLYWLLRIILFHSVFILFTKMAEKQKLPWSIAWSQSKHQNWAVCCWREQSRDWYWRWKCKWTCENEQSKRVNEILLNKIVEYEVELEWVHESIINVVKSLDTIHAIYTTKMLMFSWWLTNIENCLQNCDTCRPKWLAEIFKFRKHCTMPK
jgi:hypothetical protein